MVENFNHYFMITQPLHSHRTYEDQINMINDMIRNMTYLSEDMELVDSQMHLVEEDLHKKAKSHFEKFEETKSMDSA